MELTFTTEQKAFRLEVREWLEANVPAKPLQTFLRHAIKATQVATICYCKPHIIYFSAVIICKHYWFPSLLISINSSFTQT